MREVVISILDKLKDHSIYIENESDAADIISLVLGEYKIEKQKYEVALVADIYDQVKYYLSCKRVDGLSPLTLKNYTYMLREFSYHIYKSAADITPNDIRRYLAEKSKTVKEVSLANCGRCLNTFFKWMHEEGIITQNPMARIKIKSCDKKRFRKALTIEQIEKVRLSCEDSLDRALVEVYLGTGCRLSELLNVSMHDALEGEFRVIGKGNKERTCYLGEKAKVYLKLYQRSLGFYHDEGIFLTTDKNQRPMSDRSIQKRFKKIGEKCGIRLHPHILRHTFATMALDNGATLMEVQMLLGHETPATTQIYAKMSQVRLQTAHKRAIGAA